MSVAKDVQSKNIPLAEIDDRPQWNCRGRILPSDVEHLIESIPRNGLLQPILIRPMEVDGFKYRVVAGFSRMLACRVLRYKEIKAVIVDCNDEEADFMNLSENTVRRDLNMYQEAMWLEKIYRRYPNYNDKDIAEKLGINLNWVLVRKLVIDLPEPVQDAIARGIVTQEQIRQIHAMKSVEMKLTAIRRIKEAEERGIKCQLVEKKAKFNERIGCQPVERIEKMQTHIRENLGNSFATRCLGWVLGAIGDLELFGDIKIIAENEEIKYEIPENGLS